MASTGESSTRQKLLLRLGLAAWAVIWLLRVRKRLRRLPAAVASGSSIRRVGRWGSLARLNPGDLSVMSWNILSASLATPKRLPWVLPDALSWAQRGPALCAELRAVAADIVALQEVEAARWGEVQSWLPGYQGLLQDKGDGPGAMMLALLWKPRLTLEWAEHRSRALLAQFSWETSPASAAAAAAAGGGEDGSPSATRQHVFVVNVHLEGHPYRPNDRVSQLRNALQRLQSRQESLGMTPCDANVIICGDFNSGRSECPWRLLQRGRLEGGSTESYLPSVEVTKQTIAHPYLLHDTLATAGTPLPWTRKAPGVAATIDFIWASLQWQVAAVYHPLQGTRGPPPGCLPSPGTYAASTNPAAAASKAAGGQPKSRKGAGGGASHDSGSDAGAFPITPSSSTLTSRAASGTLPVVGSTADISGTTAGTTTGPLGARSSPGSYAQLAGATGSTDEDASASNGGTMTGMTGSGIASGSASPLSSRTRKSTTAAAGTPRPTDASSVASGSTKSSSKGGSQKQQGKSSSSKAGDKLASGGAGNGVPSPNAAASGRMLAQSCAKPTSGLPNMCCPSDHLPIAVLLRYCPLDDEEDGDDAQAWAAPASS